MKLGRRGAATGRMDKVGGRILELVGKLTGKRSTSAKGKAARVRGAGRSTKGRTRTRTTKGGRKITTGRKERARSR